MDGVVTVCVYRVLLIVHKYSSVFSRGYGAGVERGLPLLFNQSYMVRVKAVAVLVGDF